MLHFLPNSNSQISDGHVQVRYNLGGGSKTLRVSSVVVTDAEPRTVLVSRMQGNLEIVVNNSYLARSSAQAVGSNATLSVLAKYLFLGADVDVSTGEVIHGFTGCLEGVKLDRKELPLSDAGSVDFKVIKFPPSGGPISGCPLQNVGERELPNLYVYAGLAVIIGSVLLVSFVFVITCVVLSAWWRKRHGELAFGNNSRPGSPGQSGFSWQPASEPPTQQKLRPDDKFELRNRNYLASHAGSPSYQSQPDEEEHFSRSNSTFHKPLELTSANLGPVHIRQGSRQSDRSVTVPLPPEGFSAVNQANPGYLHSTPPEIDQEDGGRRPQHVRSSSGHFSVQSDDSNKASRSREMRKALDVRKRVELADADLEEIDIDEMKRYSEEGPYEPLGSIGSLYNILLDADNETRPVNIFTTGLSYEPSATSPTDHTNKIPALSRPPPEQAQVSKQPVPYTTPVRTHGEPATHVPPPLHPDSRPDKKWLKKQRNTTSKPTSPVKTNPLAEMPPPGHHRVKTEHSSSKTNPLLDFRNPGHLHEKAQLPEVEKTSKSKPHNKKWEVSIYKQENKEELDQEQLGRSRQPQRLRRSNRRSGRQVDKIRSGGRNILDEFYNITISGGHSQDNKEVTKVL